MRQRASYQDNRNLWDKTWKDRRGHIVIFQMPNVWLIAWAVLTFISLFTNGTAANVLWWLAEIALFGWALLEALRGVNYFRRGLGVIVALLVIGSIFKVGL